MRQTRGGRDKIGDSPAPSSDAIIRALRRELRPLLEDRTTTVVSHLTTLVDQRTNLGTIATAPRNRREQQQHQARLILAAWRRFRLALEGSASEVQSAVFEAGLTPAEIARVESPLRSGLHPLAGPRRDGRPRDEVRVIVLDDLMFALDAAGVPLTKTRNGQVEKGAIIVLRVLGAAVRDGRHVRRVPADLFDDICAAIDRHRAAKAAWRTRLGTETRQQETPS